jgi:hypothetical protein
MQWWIAYLWKWHQHQNLVVETVDSIKVCSNCFVPFHLETQHECRIMWNNLLYLKYPLHYYKHNESCTKQIMHTQSQIKTTSNDVDMNVHGWKKWSSTCVCYFFDLHIFVTLLQFPLVHINSRSECASKWKLLNKC